MPEPWRQSYLNTTADKEKHSRKYEHTITSVKSYFVPLMKIYAVLLW